jgi:tRNA G18 (ribose-2'-O)-methylase SpoU
MAEFLIESLDDPRLDPYRELKRKNLRDPRPVIAEGEKLVRRMLEGPCAVQSLVCTAAARDRFRAVTPPHVEVYVASTPLISRLVGFHFHRGVLACGSRPASLGIETLCEKSKAERESLVVLCPELRDPTNLGTIIRTAVAFGAKGLVVGAAGVDPFSRRVLRTSMGAVFRVPIVQTDDWDSVLDALHAAGFETVAAVVAPSSPPLSAVPRSARSALVFGNEDRGLPASLVRRCTRQVMLPMSGEVDSLNVAVAAGIILHHFAVQPGLSATRI